MSRYFLGTVSLPLPKTFARLDFVFALPMVDEGLLWRSEVRAGVLGSASFRSELVSREGAMNAPASGTVREFVSLLPRSF